jgi:hypothetical protein
MFRAPFRVLVHFEGRVIEARMGFRQPRFEKVAFPLGGLTSLAVDQGKEREPDRNYQQEKEKIVKDHQLVSDLQASKGPADSCGDTQWLSPRGRGTAILRSSGCHTDLGW